MELFKFGVKQEDPKRKERLVSIRRSIEASFKYEEDAMSKPLNASTLKRLYNIDSLWIVDNEETKKLGSANYSRELKVFEEMKDKYGNVKSFRIQRGGIRYHVLERNGKTYAFSTPIELMNADVFMMLNEIEESLSKKKIFLSSNTK